MDCPHRIPPSGTPATHHKPHKGHHARSSSRHLCKDRDRWSQSRSQSHFEDIAAQVTREATLDHNTGINAATTGGPHDDLAQPTEDTATDLAVTHHTGHIQDHSNIKALQVINP